MHKTENQYQHTLVQDNNKNRHKSETNVHETERKRHKTELTCMKRKICTFLGISKKVQKKKDCFDYQTVFEIFFIHNLTLHQN